MRDDLSNQRSEAPIIDGSDDAFAKLVATRRDVTGPTAEELGITRLEALKTPGEPWRDEGGLDAYLQGVGSI